MQIHALDGKQFVVTPERWETQEAAEQTADDLCEWLRENSPHLEGLSVNQLKRSITHN